MSVVLVDWLGRGGIAQVSETWVLELQAAGIDVTAVTRAARELGSGDVQAVTADARVGGRLAAHHAVARTAASTIVETRPSVVIVQNYVVPHLETAVFRAARTVGSRIVLVVHDDQLPSRTSGWRSGLSARVRDADVVLAHSRYVADGIRAHTGRFDIEVVPIPVQLGMLRHPRTETPMPSDDRRSAIHFGVLKRRYKGGSVVEALASSAPDGWQLVTAGVGARTSPGLLAHPGFIDPGRLVALIAASDATLAPYTHATQSGAVVLAHALGSVPVASAVGGIPEQIDDGVDGVLIAPGAPVRMWRCALEMLSDDDTRKRLSIAGVARAWRDHAAFVDAIGGIVS